MNIRRMLHRLGVRRKLRMALRRRGIVVPSIMLTAGERRIRNLLRENDPGIAVDLGAHVGEVTMELASFSSIVYAFEPLPAAARVLSRNVAMYPNVKVVRAAAAAEEGAEQFYVGDHSGGTKLPEGSSLVSAKSNLSESFIEVHKIKFSDFVASLDDRVSVLKMDIEGAEYDVILDLLNSGVIWSIDKLFVEEHYDRVGQLQDKRKEMMNLIDTLGVRERFDFDWK